MSNIERNPSFKVMALHEAARSQLKTVKTAGSLLVQDKIVPDSSEFVRFRKMAAVTKDKLSPGGKKPFA
jgi:hypothetical protein